MNAFQEESKSLAKVIIEQSMLSNNQRCVNRAGGCPCRIICPYYGLPMVQAMQLVPNKQKILDLVALQLLGSVLQERLLLCVSERDLHGLVVTRYCFACFQC